MTEKQRNLCRYRFEQAKDTLQSAELCENNQLWRDTINRSYYAAFYALKAVLALSDVDFKRHKDVVEYFNQNYVAAGKFSGAVGRKLARLQKKRETSDYDDFYIVSQGEAREQLEAAKLIIEEAREYVTGMEGGTFLV